MGMTGTTRRGCGLAVPAHLCSCRKHTTSNVILTVDNEVCILARFQMVPGGLVANGVRGPRSWQGFSLWGGCFLRRGPCSHSTASGLSSHTV